MIFNIATGLVFAGGFSCTTNNSPYTFSVIWIFELYNLIWFYNYCWMWMVFLLPIGVSNICSSLLLSSSSLLDDSIFLTILFSVLFWLFTAFTCLSCVSACSLLKELVCCSLQIVASIYLAPCLRNDTGPSWPKTLAGPFHCDDESRF